MPQAEHLFPGVAEGPVAEVMEQSSGVDQSSVGFERRIQTDQAAEGPTREMKHPQRMGETAGFRTVERQKCRPQLPYTPEALKRCAVHQIHHHGFRRLMPAQLDAAMQRIVISPLTHAVGGASATSALASASSRASIHCSDSFSQRSPSPSGFSGSGSDSKRSGAMPSP